MATEVTDATFDNEVLQRGEPVLVDFWAEGCGPGHAVAPLLERIAEGGNLKLVQVASTKPGSGDALQDPIDRT
jgi:thioredoxin 1